MVAAVTPKEVPYKNLYAQANAMQSLVLSVHLVRGVLAAIAL